MLPPVPSQLVKIFAPRGPLQQFRFADVTSFVCFRCGQVKKSKLITVYGKDWNRCLCNGCYGRLLSLYEIKAGTEADDPRADRIAEILLSLVGVDDLRQAETRLRANEERAKHLAPETVRYLATSEYVALHLQDGADLEWSPAIIGLCKAVELEIVRRILRPLATQASQENLNADKQDKELGRVAAFCADQTRKPPELGAFSYFLQTAAHSQERRATSPLLRSLLRVSSAWAGSHWVLDPGGFCEALRILTCRFRNPASHIDELGQDDYRQCRDLVLGKDGLLWRLVVSTQ